MTMTLDLSHGYRVRRCLLGLALAGGLVPPLAHAAQPIDPATVTLPSDAGRIVTVHTPKLRTPNAEPAVVFFIQDVHTNYEAQKHSAAIVEHLIKTYRIQFIMVEGGEGNASLSYLRAKAPLERRKTVAEEFLKSGEIAGEEYLDLISDYPFTLWGIESETLYNANVDTFLDTERLRERLLPILENLTHALEPIKETTYSPELKRLNRLSQAYRDGTLPFPEYLTALSQLLEHAKLSLDLYPQTKAFREARALEGQLNMQRVQTEQQQLLQELQARVPKSIFREFATIAEEAKASQQSHRFYLQLERLARDALVDMSAYRHLARYIQYVRSSQQVEPSQFAKELDRMTQQLQGLLAGNPSARSLVELDRHVTLVTHLIKLELTPDEYLSFAVEVEGQPFVQRWQQILQQHQLSSAHITQLGELEEAMPRLTQFYTEARKRDHAMARNIVEALASILVIEEGEQRAEVTTNPAILIAGGFHTHNLAKFLPEQGVTLVVIAPTVTQETDKEIYYQGLRDNAPSQQPVNDPVIRKLIKKGATIAKKEQLP